MVDEIIGKGVVEWRERRAWTPPAGGASFATAEEGVESPGHDVRGARTAVSAGGMITGAALRVRHDRGPRGRIEDAKIPLPSLFPQGLTVSNSTHNAASQKVRYVGEAGSDCYHSSQTVSSQPTNSMQDVFQKHPLAQSNVYQ